MKKIYGFSLAEALITLLIVCLITLATVPVLTKKKRSAEAQNHGKWVCTLNDNGQHTVWTKASNEWVETGDSCTFTQPLNARNFAVSAVAGGGGGASARKTTKMWTSDFRVDYYGKYKMIAIGGGGSGGQHNCGTAGGGGAGGVGYLEYNITEDVIQVKIEAGNGGSTTNWNGVAGGASVISVVSQNSTGNNSTREILRADGGGGGGGRYRNWIGACADGTGDGGFQGGVHGSGAKSYNTPAGNGVTHCQQEHCFGYTPVTKQKEINALISPYIAYTISNGAGGEVRDWWIEQIGRGGDPTSATGVYSRDGNPGYAIVTAEIYGAGGGGKSGQYKLKEFYPDFDNKSIKVTIGAGGKGGIYNSGSAANGTDGGNTVFGDFFTLAGGEGGRINYIEKVYLDTPGGDGEKSPMIYKTVPVAGLGGLSNGNTSLDGITSQGHGAGGGGGAIKPNENPGKGGDGSPGVVVIEW